ncbi:MAG: hypothetical protein NZ773_16420, partial [Dehalococcoidia bacterium]|nr:hypothetical protein [Dehalococcoidia bacterium]
MDLAWYLSPPWDIVVIVAVLTVTGALIFYLRFCAYHRRYFADKAPAAGGDCYAGLVAHVRQLVRAR